MNLIKTITLIGFISYTSLGLTQTNAVPCHPTVNFNLPQYIIGYGSLIQNQSKNKTYRGTGNNIPAMIYGYQRGWFTQGPSVGFSTTFLGVIHDKTSKFNGVIFNLPAAAMSHYDEKEHGYCREAVLPRHIKMLNHQSIPTGQFWMYVTMPQKIATPSAKYPLVQSYVDVFLSGCFAIQKQYHLKNFANDCIDTTHNWSSAWVNDRIYPRRPLDQQPAAIQIDELLSQKMPEIFRQIKIES